DSGHGRGRTGRAARDRRDGRPGAARDRQARRRAARAPGALGRRACCHHGAGVTPTTATDTLVVATGNRGKLEELRALLAALPWRVLGGRPGVRSGRFAHDHATDAENNAALLAALDVIAHSAGVTAERRGSTEGFPARFRCVLALVDPSVRGDSASTVEGACEGLITRTPRGSGGFGYDPFFVVEGTGKTMAELSNAEKNRVSHRALAFASLRPALAAV